MDIRKTIASRLKEEIPRHGFQIKGLAEAAKLTPSIVNDYLNGKRALKFNELGSICTAMGLNLFSFISKNYQTPSLQFRDNGLNESKQNTQAVENAFQVIKGLLPVPEQTNLSRDNLPNDRVIIAAFADTAAQNVKKQYGDTVEVIYDRLNIPVIPVYLDGFEALFLESGEKCAVCVNRKASAVSRLHFSLLHELSHYFFDRGSHVVVDTDRNMYARNIAKGMEREFFATKFAQFFLVPLSVVLRMALDWPKFDKNIMQGVVASGRCSIDVLANALFDAIEIKKGARESYSNIYAVLKENVRSTQIVGIDSFLDRKQSEIEYLLMKNESIFSEDVLMKLKNDLWGYV